MRYYCISITAVQDNTTFVVDVERGVDHVDDVQETANSLGSRSPPAAPWSSLPPSSSHHDIP